MLHLTPLADEYAGNLSYGQQKLLSFGMTMMSKPHLMLLDEPIAGVNPTLVRQLMKHIVHIHQQGCTILIVEHNIPVVMELCRRVVVMNNGKVIADGDPTKIREDPVVLQAYFGK
jgi:ABC-type branched-subunit amino acid transport system ATPase component